MLALIFRYEVIDLFYRKPAAGARGINPYAILLTNFLHSSDNSVNKCLYSMSSWLTCQYDVQRVVCTLEMCGFPWHGDVVVENSSNPVPAGYNTPFVARKEYVDYNLIRPQQ